MFLFFSLFLHCFLFNLIFLNLFSLNLIELCQSSGSDESLAAGHQQHVRPHGPLVLRLGPGPSATVGGPVGSQRDGEVIRCGFFPPPPSLPSCSSSSSASLLLVAAPLPSQPISSRLVRGAVYSAHIHSSVACTPLFFFFSLSMFFRKRDTSLNMNLVIRAVPLFSDCQTSSCCSSPQLSLFLSSLIIDTFSTKLVQGFQSQCLILNQQIKKEGGTNCAACGLESSGHECVPVVFSSFAPDF